MNYTYYVVFQVKGFYYPSDAIITTDTALTKDGRLSESSIRLIKEKCSAVFGKYQTNNETRYPTLAEVVVLSCEHLIT